MRNRQSMAQPGYSLLGLPALTLLSSPTAPAEARLAVRVLPFADHNHTNLATRRACELTPLLRAWLTDDGIPGPGANSANRTIPRPRNATP